jgi:hypothetical protein
MGIIAVAGLIATQIENQMVFPVEAGNTFSSGLKVIAADGR